MKNVELYYEVLNASALLPWMLMILLPTWWFTQKAINTFIFPMLFSIVYVAIMLSQLEVLSSASFDTMAGLKSLSSNDWMVLFGWVHYLAFDMIVGGFILRDAQSNNFPHWQIVPFLLMCLLLGPLGWFGYWIYRSIKLKGFYFN